LGQLERRGTRRRVASMAMPRRSVRSCGSVAGYSGRWPSAFR
jgi:hypothetical protein